jgi:hypothetical protein
MRGTVFAHADTVVGCGVDDLEVLQSSHTDGGVGVEVEHEEAVRICQRRRISDQKGR